MPLPPGFDDTHYHVDDIYQVARDKVREFALAVKSEHPAHHDERVARDLGYSGLVAPPTFFAIFGALAQRRLLELGGLDLTRVMQTDQRAEFHKPLVVGAHLSCEVSVDSVRAMAGADIIVTKNVVADADGEPVLTTYTTVVHRELAADDVGANDEIMEAVRAL
ncbi:(3R)-hydroxyacyl-ACP dehydratase subunit HadA [Tomitella gaofuii]|uniref:(3R)-hydroxyacyl-ACP dehydratase subunit HadA n=1 Tax=Tomitella gaofuii TaxID=2760083 RepID=UPI0015F83E12|nr:(3R)-hydroxyacyl-ACP dehydratase subunit HadA [Tomitella gaofuii]